jgi:metal-dependent amidase/aminoacylase/carboxypeptidase family protein
MGAEMQTGAKLVTSVFEDPGNDLLKNSVLIGEFEENFASIGESIDPDPFLLGSSDIGNLSYHMPVLHPMVKTAAEGAALHTDEFKDQGKSDTAYSGMINGMKAVLMTAVRIFADPDFLQRAREEFQRDTKGL